ncbi:outer membrane beta-barrel protein [Cytophaga aurantiaca]|uniref:outer membrane beta-barrel protein n=1 Tax=Cytophaga aurantiaca TaxID=29530 RepID=UPI00036514B4|nr:outer membrane beta-barrel protein [Cytophaga aurantiaca]
MLICSYQGQAQVHKKKQQHTSGSPSKSFEKTQFYIGIRGGLNFTKANVLNSYSSFVSPSNPDEHYTKTYKDYATPGGTFGLEFSFSYENFTASFQPNYRRQIYSYSNTYEWQDANSAQNYLQLTYTQKTHLNYIELPLFIRYNIVAGGFKPFVQAGFYYAILNGATKQLDIEGVDHSGGTSRNFSQPSSIIGADNLFIKSSIGAALGLGTTYKVGNIRLILDATYRLGLNNISNVQNRYSANPLSGAGDVSDDIKLNNITISFGCLFPMKFVTSSAHKAVD